MQLQTCSCIHWCILRYILLCDPVRGRESHYFFVCVVVGVALVIHGGSVGVQLEYLQTVLTVCYIDVTVVNVYIVG